MSCTLLEDSVKMSCVYSLILDSFFMSCYDLKLSICIHLCTKCLFENLMSHCANNFMDLHSFQVPMVAEKAPFFGSLGVYGHLYLATLLNLVLVQI